MLNEAEFHVTDLAPQIGSLVRASKDFLLGGTASAALRELLERRGVLVFPEIGFTDDEQIAFTKTLGELAHESGEGEGVYPITMDPTINPIAEYLKGAFFWHIDGTMSDKPILASILGSRRLAAEGGETEFCNTYAAWDDLPAGEKGALEDLKVVHAFWRSQLYVQPEPSAEQLQAWQGLGQKVLPLVWKHRSGRQSLVLGSTASQVVGIDLVESEALLVKLRDWATRAQFVYRHQWKLGDLVIWENTGTMHRALPYDRASGRLMHRTKLEGEEAFA